MRRKQMAVALAVATATSLVIAPQAQAATFADQQIKWQKCFDTPPPELPEGSERLECGEFTAPMDWHNPTNGKTITIAVSRLLPKNGKPKTTIFTNPGGPGGAGRVMPAIFLTRPKLSENAEIIGIDVRGTGDSTNATCGNFNALGQTDPRDRGKANLDLIYGGMELFAKFCQTKSGELGRHITTEQTVRDLDLLRQVLGREKVDWLGYSGGSWMGAYYATYFPKTLDKIVLDSNTEFTADWEKIFGEWGMGFERRFRVDFLPWVAKHDNVYHLGKTAEEVRQNYENTRKKLAEQPLPLPDGGAFGAFELDSILMSAQYNKYTFDMYANAFAVIAGTIPTPQAKEAAKFPDAPIGTRYGILCNDTPFKSDRKALERQAARNGAKWPLFGYNQIAAPCAFWDRPDVRLKRPDGLGVSPALMVQTDLDPATPLEGAQRAHRKFAGSKMLTVKGEGDHAIYGFDNECVNEIVEHYLVDREVPAKDLTCHGMPLPEPGRQNSSRQQSTVVDRAEKAAAQLGW